MLVSLNWLKEFVNIDMGPEEVAHILTMGGIEVEALKYEGIDLKTCLTARIDRLAQHPSSGKLNIAEIDLGDRVEKVVCGAPNSRQGQIVAYAPDGTNLPGGIAVCRRNIKGIESPGMLCSEKETGSRRRFRWNSDF